jgi:ABC-2 type transport system permease protein
VSVLAVARREWPRALRPGRLWLGLGLPLALFALLAALYSGRYARDLPVAVLDLDHSALSRQLARALDATPSLAVVEAAHSLDEIADALRAGRILGALAIPAGLEADLKAGRPATATLYRGTANLVTGNLLFKDGSAAVRTLSAGVALRRQQAAGAGTLAPERVQPLRVETRTLYNPSTDYEFFLVPGLLAVLLMMAVLVTAAPVAGEILLDGSLPGLWRDARDRPLALLAGLALPRLALPLLLAALLSGLVLPLAGVVPAAPWPALATLLALLALASLALALAIGLWLPRGMSALQAAIFIATPAFIFTGITFPVEAMPPFHRIVARLLPSTPFAEGFLSLYQRGAGWAVVLPAAAQLLAFTALGLGAAWLRLRGLRPVPCHARNAGAAPEGPRP